jgi:sugar phosphate isomerase/epimerase
VIIGISLKAFELEPLERAVEHVARIGYKHVELRSHESQLPPRISTQRVGEIARLMRDNGLTVSCLATFSGDYSRKDEAGCEETFAEFQRYTEHAHALGCPLVRHWSGWEPSRSVSAEAYERSVRWMRRAAEHAGIHGVKAALEIHHGTLVDELDAIERYLRDVNHPAVGVMHDAANMYHDGIDHGRRSIVRLGPHILSVHFKDVAELLDDSHPAAFSYRGRLLCHRPIGAGGVDQWSIARGLREIGYQAFGTVESAVGKAGAFTDPYELARREYAALRAIIEEEAAVGDSHVATPEPGPPIR